MAQAHSGLLLAARGSLRVIECAGCGFAHLDTLPDAAALADYYRTDFWQCEKPGALAQIEERLDWWAMLHGDWLEIVERYAPGSPSISVSENDRRAYLSFGQDLLDVGCGFGHFMRTASERDWGVWGIEPSEAAADYAVERGGTVWHGAWETFMPVDAETEIMRTRFDCISALWLIEHLPDPLRFLRWCRDRLTDGGVLLAVVPNDFTPLQRHLSTNGKVTVPWWFIHRTHTAYFTPVAFANLLGRAGFRVVEQTTTYPIENFMLSGKDYTANPALGAALHGQVEAQDLSMTRADRIEFYRLMARRGEGREIVMIARRE